MVHGRGERDDFPAGEPPPELGPPAAEFSRTRGDLERWKRGDERAFEDLWRRYLPALEVLVAGRIRSSLEPALRAKLDADDVLQDVALTVFAKLGDFEYRGPGSVLAWMTRIATRVVGDWADYWRAGKRHPSLERPLPGQPGAEEDAIRVVLARGPGPCTSSDAAERRRRIAVALSTLPDRIHTILLWRFYGGAEWDEIAAELRAPSGDSVRMECYGKAVPALAAALRAPPGGRDEPAAGRA